MIPLKVLLPLALLVAVTLAEFPSSNQIRLYGKEGSNEDDILLPGNPALGKEDNIVENSKVPTKVVPDDKKTDEDKTPGNDKKPDESKTPAEEKKPDESKTAPDGKKTDGTKTPADVKKSDEIKDVPNDKKTGEDKTPGNDKKPDESKTPAEEKKPDESKTAPDDKKTDGTKTPADVKKSDEIKDVPNDKKTGEDKTPGNDKKPDDTKTPNGKPDSGKDGDKDSTKPEVPNGPDYRLSDNIKPTHYSIDLKVNQNDLSKKNYQYEGSVSIDILVEKETNVIKLHYDRKSIEVNQRKLVKTDTGDEIKITEKEEKNLDVSICELTADTKLEPKKTYTLTFEYKGKVNDNSQGFYKGSYLNEDGELRWYAVTHFEPLGARSAFPCFDEPALKAEFTISITHSVGYTAISNMPVEKETKIDKNWKQVIFKKTPQMSTYLVAFAITDFEKTGKKAQVYSRKNVMEMGEYAATTGEQVLKELEDYTDIKFELPKIDQIALPLLRPGAMENWGLVTYRETALLYDENVNATIDQQKVASIIAHEFAHQWFGNLVSPKWWTYLWLNEGFATYFQYYIADKINPDWHFMDQFNVATLQGRAFVYDADWAKTRPMDKEESNEKEIGDLFDDVAYHKAASVIRMFVHVLGEDKFQKGIKSYLKENKGGVATSADLFKALDEAVGKNTLPDDYDVKKVFGDWANKKGYPLITVTKNKKTKSVTVEQQPFYLEEPSEDTKSTWYIPLNYAQENGEHDFEDTSVQEWLTEDKIKITQNIEKDGWIIFNKQQTGYYRVNYDKENWVAIALYLKGENFTTIHPLNRAQLIDDALNLANAGLLGYDIALDLLDYLQQETEYIVWKSAFAALAKLNKLLAATEHYSDFSKYLVTVTDTLMQNLTYTPEDDEPYLRKLLRVDAMKWACDSGSEACKIYATEQVEKWLSDPFNNATLPRDLQQVYLCGALRNATLEEWKRVFVKYAGSTNTEEKALILSTLGCSLSEETLQYLLNLAIQPDSIFKGRVLDVFQTVYTNSATGVQVTLDFILQNINKLLTYDAQFYDNLEKYIKDLGSRVVLEDDVTKLREIVAKEIIPAEKTEEAVSAAERNVKWLKKNGKDISNWFKSYNTITTTEIPETTTKKGNGAGSLSFTTLLLAVPLVLARLR